MKKRAKEREAEREAAGGKILNIMQGQVLLRPGNVQIFYICEVGCCN